MALFSQLEPLTYLAIAATCVVAAALGGMSGMGGSTLIAVLIAPIVGVEAVLPVMSVLMLIANASRIWFYFRALRPRIALLLMSTSVPGAFLGSLFFVSVDVRMISGVFGLVLILSVPVRRLLERRRVYLGETGLTVFGFPFGFLSGTAMGAGMLLVPMLLGAGLAGPALLATDAAVAVAIALVRILVFGRFEALTLELTLAGILMGVCTLPGTWLAAWIVARTDVRIHTAIMEALVLAGGSWFAWQAFA